MNAPQNIYEFCQYVHTDGRRCTLGFGHMEEHYVQPQSSATVQTINRQEKANRRVADPISEERIVSAIDRAVNEEAVQKRQDDARNNALGMIPQQRPVAASATSEGAKEQKPDGTVTQTGDAKTEADNSPAVSATSEGAKVEGENA